MKFKKLPSLVILLTLLVASCGTPPSSNQNVNIEIQTSGDEQKEITVETISQQNCKGTADVDYTVERSKAIQFSMEVQTGASVNANGQLGFAGTDIELGATVASQYGQSYGTTETLTRSITVRASPGSRMQHTIRQLEIWKIGKAKITVGGQETTIPFKFRSGFGIELADSQNLGCDNLVATPIAANSGDTTASTQQSPNSCFPQTGWTPPQLTTNGDWLYDCLSSGEGNWVGQDEAWKAINWKKGTSQSEIVTIVIPQGATKMGLGCDPCTVLKPDGTSVLSPNGNFGSFKPNISLNVNSGEIYKVKIFGGDTCPSRPQATPPCSPEIYIWFNLP